MNKQTIKASEHNSIMTFGFKNGRNGIFFRLDGDNIVIDLSLGGSFLFSQNTLEFLREDFKANGISNRDADDLLDMMAERVYTSIIAKRIAENIRG